MKHTVGRTRNGIPVYVDLIYSQAATHIAQHPHILGLMREALSKNVVRGMQQTIAHDMGRIIGNDAIIETSSKDAVFYARQAGSDLYTRFIKTSKQSSTQFLTLVMHRDVHNKYEVQDAWIGGLVPPQPGSALQTAESQLFWENHARIFSSHRLEPGTLTKESPF